MKQEKYLKALGEHSKKLAGYSSRLAGLVIEMMDDDCSLYDVVAMLEAEKSVLLGAAFTASSPGAGLADVISAILEED